MFQLTHLPLDKMARHIADEKSRILIVGGVGAGEFNYANFIDANDQFHCTAR